MLKTRKIIKTSSGNYSGVFGQGNANFVYGVDALAQILTHQILTIRGELKTRTDFGVDWFNRTDTQNEKIILDTQIKNIIHNNPYVKTILSFNSFLNTNTNTYNLNFKASTTEGLLEVNI